MSCDADLPPLEIVGSGEPTPWQSASKPKSWETRLRAPDRTTLELVIAEGTEGREAGLLDLSHYELAGPRAALAITDVELDEDGHTVWLTTEPQALGLEYRLRWSTPGDDLQLERRCLAADQTHFWTTNLKSGELGESEIAAERVAVSEHAVLYAEFGTTVENADKALAFFDEQIFPAETELFGQAPDRDGNGRIVLLGTNAGAAYAGYFSVVNAHDDDTAMALWGRHSNEMEMLYINVSSGTLMTQTVVAHELTHLLYHEHHDTAPAWSYHNEGLAECAVRVVNGNNDGAVGHYFADPTYLIRNGLSLVDWQQGNYAQYAQAFLFWSYLAGQLGGVEGYGELFALDGSPTAVDAFLQERLGVGFGEAQLHALIASWVQAPSGTFSFNGVLDPPAKPKIATEASISLAPFAGVFLEPEVTEVDYSGDEGPNVTFAGINGFGEVDLEPPFDVADGVLIALNTSFDVTLPAEALGMRPGQREGRPDSGVIDPADHGYRHVGDDVSLEAGLQHPPPFDPRHLEQIRAWQRRRFGL
ncbi:MAG: hypothetical protein R3B72_15155 [Polyangiaceae bacterium]